MHGGKVVEGGGSTWASLGRPWLSPWDVPVFEFERGAEDGGGGAEPAAMCQQLAPLRCRYRCKKDQGQGPSCVHHLRRSLGSTS